MIGIQKRVDPKPDPYAKLPLALTRNPGRSEPKQVVLDSTRPTPRMRARVYKTSNQAITTGTGTVVVFAGLTFDNVGLFTANKFTMPSTGKITGPWRLITQVDWAGDNAGTFRQVQIRKNGSTILATAKMQPVTNDQTLAVTLLIDDPSVGDYFEVLITHDAGHNVNVLSGTDLTFYDIKHEW